MRAPLALLSTDQVPVADTVGIWHSAHRVGGEAIAEFNLDRQDEAPQLVEVRGTEYPLQLTGNFGLAQRAVLGKILRALRGIENGAPGDEVAALRRLAAVAVPSAPLDVIQSLSRDELREICFCFLARAAGCGVTAVLAPNRGATSSFVTLVATVLRDTQPFTTIHELGLDHWLVEPDDSESS